jgi:predicted nucleic acid-binding protein
MEIGVRDLRNHMSQGLALARASDPIQISEAVMIAWSRIIADSRAAGIRRTVKLTDTLIAATAVEHGLPVVTQDSDFDQIADAHSALSIVKV